MPQLYSLLAGLNFAAVTRGFCPWDDSALVIIGSLILQDFMKQMAYVTSGCICMQIQAPKIIQHQSLTLLLKTDEGNPYSIADDDEQSSDVWCSTGSLQVVTVVMSDLLVSPLTLQLCDQNN
jgi:hypothetical protein